MKKLFLIFAKLLGLVQLYRAFMSAAQLAAMLVMISRTDPVPLRGILLGAGGMAVYLAISLVIAWVLLAKTEWLATKVGILDDAPVADLERVPALLVGICLIGTFVSVETLPRLARILIDLQRVWSHAPHQMVWSPLVPAALQLFLGLFLALKPAAVATLLAPKPAPPAAP